MLNGAPWCQATQNWEPKLEEAKQEGFLEAEAKVQGPAQLGEAFGLQLSADWLQQAELLQVQANLVALRVLPMLQNGVSVLGSRWGGQPVLRSLCALQVAVVFV